MRKRNSKGQFAKKTKNSETSFIQLNTYSSPIVKEVDGEAWVSYGEYNDHFQFLIDRFNGSPTNSACINGISQQIYGKGLNATDSSRRPNEYAQMVSLFKKEIVRKLCYDLKLMGQCAIQVVYSKDRTRIAEIEHMPIETLRAAKCDEDGNVPAYYYFNDWVNLTNADEPIRISAWGMSNDDIEILYIKPYKSGFYYYSPVDYQGGLQYSELEEEVSNYHLNNILNGLSPGLLLNFNNGVPNQQERKLIESRIAAKFQGSSNSGRMIVSFNDNKESQAEITPVQLSDAHNQYQFLSEECEKKVMLSHRVVSPKLLGINNGSGFGNNADEITAASILMDNTIIRPFQELLIDNFDKILAYNEISLNLYFTTLQPLEFTEVDKTLQDKETIEEETGLEMSKVNLEKYPWDTCIKEQTERYGAEAAPKICGYIKANMATIDLKQIDGKQAYATKEEAQEIAKMIGCKGFHEHIEEDGKTWYMPCESHSEFLSDDLGEQILNNLKGEIIGEEYELVDQLDTDVQISDEDWANLCIKQKKSFFRKFADEVTSRPNGFSYLDSKNYKIRYKYAVGSTKQMKDGNESRDFCKNMMNLSKRGVVYRLEGIDEASRDGVNDRLGHKGKAYDLFKFKGGVYCRHKWVRVLYRLKKNTEPSDNLDAYKKDRNIPPSFIKSPWGTKQSEIAPVNMPNQGHYPGVK